MSTFQKFFQKYFQDTDEIALIKLFQSVSLEEFDAGQVVFKEGAPSNDKFYVILSGEVGIIEKKRTIFEVENSSLMNEMQAAKFYKELGQNLLHRKKKRQKTSFQHSPKLTNEYLDTLNINVTKNAHKAQSEGEQPEQQNQVKIINIQTQADAKFANRSPRKSKTVNFTFQNKNISGDLSEETNEQESKAQELLELQANANQKNIETAHNSQQKLKKQISLFEHFEQKIPGKQEIQIQIENPIEEILEENEKDEVNYENIIPIQVIQPERQLKKIKTLNENELQEIIDEYGTLKHKLEVGSGFGEVALTKPEGKRTATVICLQSVDLMVILRENFINILRDFNRQTIIRNNFLLSHVPEMNQIINPNVKENIQWAFSENSYNNNQIMTHQDKPGYQIFFIFSGSCSLIKKCHQQIVYEDVMKKEDIYLEIPICELGPNSCFGEEILLPKNEAHLYYYTVRVTSLNAKMLVISAKNLSIKFTYEMKHALLDVFKLKELHRKELINDLMDKYRVQKHYIQEIKIKQDKQTQPIASCSSQPSCLNQIDSKPSLIAKQQKLMYYLEDYNSNLKKNPSVQMQLQMAQQDQIRKNNEMAKIAQNLQLSDEFHHQNKILGNYSMNGVLNRMKNQSGNFQVQLQQIVAKNAKKSKIKPKIQLKGKSQVGDQVNQKQIKSNLQDQSLSIISPRALKLTEQSIALTSARQGPHLNLPLPLNQQYNLQSNDNQQKAVLKQPRIQKHQTQDTSLYIIRSDNVYKNIEDEKEFMRLTQTQSIDCKMEVYQTNIKKVKKLKNFQDLLEKVNVYGAIQQGLLPAQNQNQPNETINVNNKHIQDKLMSVQAADQNINISRYPMPVLITEESENNAQNATSLQQQLNSENEINAQQIHQQTQQNYQQSQNQQQEDEIKKYKLQPNQINQKNNTKTAVIDRIFKMQRENELMKLPSNRLMQNIAFDFGQITQLAKSSQQKRMLIQRGLYKEKALQSSHHLNFAYVAKKKVMQFNQIKMQQDREIIKSSNMVMQNKRCFHSTSNNTNKGQYPAKILTNQQRVATEENSYYQNQRSIGDSNSMEHGFILNSSLPVSQYQMRVQTATNKTSKQIVCLTEEGRFHPLTSRNDYDVKLSNIFKSQQQADYNNNKQISQFSNIEMQINNEIQQNSGTLRPSNSRQSSQQLYQEAVVNCLDRQSNNSSFVMQHYQSLQSKHKINKQIKRQQQHHNLIRQNCGTYKSNNKKLLIVDNVK